jgi:hypothetical protein
LFDYAQPLNFSMPPKPTGLGMQKTVANAHDSAFEANLRRTTHNLYVQLAYTWSKSIDQIVKPG